MREPGEYSMRGGIVDIFPAGLPEPVRLDFFGDELEAARYFDAGNAALDCANSNEIVLAPVSEIDFSDSALALLRKEFPVGVRLARRRSHLRSGPRAHPPPGRRAVAAAVLREAGDAVRLSRPQSADRHRIRPPAKPPASAWPRPRNITRSAGRRLRRAGSPSTCCRRTGSI